MFKKGPLSIFQKKSILPSKMGSVWKIPFIFSSFYKKQVKKLVKR
jgi:hypothetical protein